MKSLRIQVDQDRVRQLGVSSKSLAEALNAVTSGMVVTEVRDSIYLTDLVVRSADEQRTSLQTLKNLQVALDNGQTIPLSQVASVQYELEPPVIWRRNLLPTITVQADVIPGIEAKTVNKQLAPAIAQLAEKLPEGYTIEAGGTIEESAKGLNSIVAVFPVMIMLMLIILMVQLQSLQKMFLVISVAPLGLIGVVPALLPTGTPMGFVAILGIIALSGMIIRNFGDPDRPDRHGPRPGIAPLGCSDRRDDPPFSADRADRGGRFSRHDPDRGGGLLGTDGLCDHRRPLRRDPADPALPLGPLCRVVPHQGARAGSRRGCARCHQVRYAPRGSRRNRIRVRVLGDVPTKGARSLGREVGRDRDFAGSQHRSTKDREF
jgi:hypothetical protein